MQTGICWRQKVGQRVANEFFAIDMEEKFKSPVQANVAPGAVFQINRERDGLDQLFDQMQLL